MVTVVLPAEFVIVDTTDDLEAEAEVAALLVVDVFWLNQPSQKGFLDVEDAVAELLVEEPLVATAATELDKLEVPVCEETDEVALEVALEAVLCVLVLLPNMLSHQLPFVVVVEDDPAVAPELELEAPADAVAEAPADTLAEIEFDPVGRLLVLTASVRVACWLDKLLSQPSSPSSSSTQSSSLMEELLDRLDPVLETELEPEVVVGWKRPRNPPRALPVELELESERLLPRSEVAEEEDEVPLKRKSGIGEVEDRETLEEEVVEDEVEDEAEPSGPWNPIEADPCKEPPMLAEPAPTPTPPATWPETWPPALDPPVPDPPDPEPPRNPLKKLAMSLSSMFPSTASFATMLSLKSSAPAATKLSRTNSIARFFIIMVCFRILETVKQV